MKSKKIFNKIIVICSLLIIASSCGNQKNDTQDNAVTEKSDMNIDYNYVNNEYGYKLMIPNELLEQGAIYVFKDYDNNGLAKVVYQYSETDKEVLLESWLYLFEIGIYYKKELPTDIQGEIVAETDDFIYTFKDCCADVEIESTWAAEKYKIFSPYFHEIKDSFSIK